jgi:hypothetical protein
VLATLLTTKAGPDLEPLMIVGVVVSYIITLLLSRSPKAAHVAAPQSAPTPTLAHVPSR